MEPFTIHVDESALVDLRDRLARTRWPDAETVDDWTQGVPLSYLQQLCEYWRIGYDWRRVEVRLNALPQFRTEIEGMPVHFLHVRSPHTDAAPLVLTHGWPGSVLEFLKVIEPLTDPPDAADAFHVVIPALPGYGFSGKPAETGWGVQRFATLWAELMTRLGYERFAAQGGDWGGFVTAELSRQVPDRLLGIHVNWLAVSADALRALGELTVEEQQGIDDMRRHRDDGGGYSRQQMTRPQTLGYGLADSPAGQCAWIVEKFSKWSESGGNPETVFTRDELLDDVTLYWLTNTGASSARLYWESLERNRRDPFPVTVPSGYSAFPGEIARFSRRWVETRFEDLRHYGTPGRGGHFAALERPDEFVDEVRAAFRAIRGER